MTDAAPYQYARTLAFRTVDPLADAAVLTAFGRDLYVESLGDDAAFRRDFGRYGQKFPLWIASCAAADPAFAALLTEDDAPAGLVALGRSMRDGDVGLVHHFYVKPSHRGRGFGGLLDDYARDVLRAAGCVRARLNVTARNARARRFYIAQGWRDIGGAPGPSSLRFMEVAL